MFKPALSLFRHHELPFSEFAFPCWQAWLALVAIGLLVGLDPAMRQASPDMPAMPLWAGPTFSVVLILLCFPLIVLFLKWWMKRGQRWDGRGDLFNLVAASWLVANVLGVTSQVVWDSFATGLRQFAAGLGQPARMQVVGTLRCGKASAGRA